MEVLKTMAKRSGRRAGYVLAALSVALLVVLAARERGRCPVWIVYSAPASAESERDAIWIAQPGERRKKLFESAANTRLGRFSLSDDGRSLAFFASRGTGGAVWQLQILSLSDGSVRQIVAWDPDERGIPWELAWSPNSSKIAFFAGPRLWIVNLRGGAAKPFDLPSDLLHPSGRARHDLLFPPLIWDAEYGLISGLGSIRPTRSGNRAMVKLTSTPRNQFPTRCPVFWSPDGMLAASLADCRPMAKPTIVLYSPSGQVVRRLRLHHRLPQKQRVAAFPKWTHDGRYLVAALSTRDLSQDSGDSTICVVDVRTGRTWHAPIPLRFGIDTWDAASGPMPNQKANPGI